MTISSLTNRKNQASDGILDTFIYDFLILDADHLKVYLDGDIDNPLFPSVVTGVGDNNGGSVGFSSPPAAGTLSLVREVPYNQTFDYITGGKFPADTHERLADLLVMMAQELSDKMDRSLQLPVSSDINGLVLPEPVAEYLLQWNSAGDALQNIHVSTLGALVVTTAFSELLLADANAPDARATLGVDFKGALVYLSANQSIPDNAGTNLLFDAEGYDTDSIHDNVTDKHKLVVPVGVTKVRLTGSVRFNTSGTGRREIAIHKNFVSDQFLGASVAINEAPVGTRNTIVPIETPIIDVVAGDFFYLNALQNSTAALDVIADSGSGTWFAMEVIEQ